MDAQLRQLEAQQKVISTLLPQADSLNDPQPEDPRSFQAVGTLHEWLEFLDWLIAKRGEPQFGEGNDVLDRGTAEDELPFPHRNPGRFDTAATRVSHARR